MKLSCDEATAICDKSQYKEASLWEKIKLGLHLFLCKKCGKYAKQNAIMTKCYEFRKSVENSHKPVLDNDEKMEMEEKLKMKF